MYGSDRGIVLNEDAAQSPGHVHTAAEVFCDSCCPAPAIWWPACAAPGDDAEP